MRSSQNRNCVIDLLDLQWKWGNKIGMNVSPMIVNVLLTLFGNEEQDAKSMVCTGMCVLGRLGRAMAWRSGVTEQHATSWILSWNFTSGLTINSRVEFTSLLVFASVINGS